ncbi:PREDICTED: ribosomal RNA-processing protein 7 homolog A-like [Priapulus caudatus]|uniref:Ribosomal RNA-processing protein 7 homolog A-like n=1 Tax=Priapulus caudatus TaxID=37621 RepID=A0ABM1ENR0_PRICU|nr:PREDICTED: ribosomal RNA-processing protein 7 homolog A-like [Priapulus caudatus]
MYIKGHNVVDSNPCKPADRTLFVLSVPPYCNEECLERLFSECGAVEKVHIHQKPTSSTPNDETSNFFKTSPSCKGYKVAYIVFKTTGCIQKAKEMSAKSPSVLFSDEHLGITGMQKWCHEYINENSVDTEALQAEVDEYIAEYDKKIKEEKKREKDSVGQADDEGWVTVVRHGKKPGLARTEAFNKRIAQRERKKRQKQELKNFYAFQIRDSKREHLAQLRQKFDEDKKKISAMKSQRKFKPF